MVCLRDIAAGSDMNLTHLGVAVILIVVTILLAYLVNGIVKHLLRHLYEILKTIHEVQKGRLVAACSSSYSVHINLIRRI